MFQINHMSIPQLRSQVPNKELLGQGITCTNRSQTSLKKMCKSQTRGEFGQLFSTTLIKCKFNQWICHCQRCRSIYMSIIEI